MLYPYLVDDAGNWTTRNDVRNVRVMCSGSGPSQTYNNEFSLGGELSLPCVTSAFDPPGIPAAANPKK